MISLRKWYFQNTQLPLLAIIIILIFSQIGYSLYFKFEKEAQTNKLKNSLSNIITIGIEQKNRTLIESAIETIALEFKTKNILFCKKNKVIMSYPENQASCNLLKNKSLFFQNYKMTFSGHSGIKILFNSPSIFSSNTFIIFNSILILLIFFIIYIIYSLQHKLKDQIFKPLINHFESEEKLPILELNQLKINQKKIFQIREKEKLATLASQVAHDIRSPLAALDMILKDLNKVSETQRYIIRSSVSRIHDIANNLLNSKPNISYKNSVQKPDTVMLTEVISSIITEKRTQYREKIDLSINFNIDQEAYGLFVNINIAEFSRVLSNLINNSVEAFNQSQGKIDVTARTNKENNNQIKITISDNGKGIPKDIISKLGEEGKTFDKKNGSGLGLFHAKNIIKSFKGTIEITSKVTKGTTINIILPKEKPPSTFISKISISLNQIIVILDDDQSIHQIWNRRFQTLFQDKNKISKIELIHFSDPHKFEKWFNNNKRKISLFLIDYEFIGYHINGIKIINNHNIQSKSILVTSRYTEEKIRLFCKDENIKLLPKGLAVYVPIIISQKEIEEKSLKKRKCCIFLEDDFFIRMGWKSIAKKKGIELDLYDSGDELLKVAKKYDLRSIFYIDSSLGENQRGEDVAKKLSTLGFTELYLATGYKKDHFSNISFIKDVISKECPF